MSEDKRRKITFHLNPETVEADAMACGFLAKLPTRDKGRAMRSMMVAGAALMVIDPRLPDVLTAAMREGVTRAELLGVLSALLPADVAPHQEPPVVYSPPDNSETVSGLKNMFGK